MARKRAKLNTEISKKEQSITKQGWKKRTSTIRHARDRWIAGKKMAHVEAGLYQKTIGGTTYVYRPLGTHLWERTSLDGRLRTLVKYLPDDLS